MIRIIKYLLLFFLLIAVLGYLTYNYLFDNNISFSKYTSFANLSKRHFGGIVYNETSKTLKVTDYIYIKEIPPHKSSRDIGLFDADSIIIDSPMFFDHKEYNNKVLKFCDYGKFKVIEDKGKIVIQPLRPVWICKLINDFGFYDSIDDAFN